FIPVYLTDPAAQNSAIRGGEESGDRLIFREVQNMIPRCSFISTPENTHVVGGDKDRFAILRIEYSGVLSIGICFNSADLPERLCADADCGNKEYEQCCYFHIRSVGGKPLIRPG